MGRGGDSRAHAVGTGSIVGGRTTEDSFELVQGAGDPKEVIEKGRRSGSGTAGSIIEFVCCHTEAIVVDIVSLMMGKMTAAAGWQTASRSWQARWRIKLAST